MEDSAWYWRVAARAAASQRRRRAAQASAEWPEFAPPVELAEGPLGEAQRADREIARLTAVKARALAQFASTRPASADRQQGEKGAMSAERWAARPEVLRPVSEWAGQETSIALSLSNQSAEGQLERALLLVDRLPGTLAALESGALHAGHAFPMLDVVAPIADAQVRAEVEAEVLRWATGRVVTTPQLGAKGRREAVHRDARETARQLAEAIQNRGVHLRAERTPGMASVATTTTVPEAHALYRALSAMADALDSQPDDPRSRGQRMVDCLLDLVLRPGECEVPPVQVLLTVVTSVSTLLGGDAPGEVDGQPVPAELVRDLLAALTAQVRELAPDAGDEPQPDPGDDDDDAGKPTAPTPTAPTPTAPTPGVQAPSAWMDAHLRCVLAAEHSGQPEPIPSAVLRAWAEEEQAERLLVGVNNPVRPAGPAAETWAAEPNESARVGPAPGDGSGWWSRADQAVDEASIAVRDAEAALGHAHRLVDTARRADNADETAWRDGPGGRVTATTDALEALRAATDVQRRWLADLLAATAGGGLADRPRIALTDALSGTLLALTDHPGLRRVGCCVAPACRAAPGICRHDLSGRPGAGPPPPTDGYRPGAELDRFVRARDRRCRFPGCRRRVPNGGELDHHVPHPEGPTAASNLAGYCTADHRGKHQAPGWRSALRDDGVLTVTTPGGITTTSSPLPY